MMISTLSFISFGILSKFVAGGSPLKLTLVVINGFPDFWTIFVNLFVGILTPSVEDEETHFKNSGFFFFSMIVYAPGRYLDN
jgi:hypothetical protein